MSVTQRKSHEHEYVEQLMQVLTLVRYPLIYCYWAIANITNSGPRAWSYLGAYKSYLFSEFNVLATWANMCVFSVAPKSLRQGPW